MHSQAHLNRETVFPPTDSLSLHRIWQRDPWADALPRVACGGGRRRGDTARPRDEIDAYALRALASNGFGDAEVGPLEHGPARGPRAQDARTPGPSPSPRRVEAMLHGIGAFARRVHATWKRQRQASATRLVLHELDARMLRDLGFDPSEIRSIGR